ncbi:MAG TPA: bifunctional nuclease family protein [Acidimicrobiales bacterium]|nr:bifunctional nuclease family protein [Acidimicrobiales bacterium]
MTEGAIDSTNLDSGEELASALQTQGVTGPFESNESELMSEAPLQEELMDEPDMADSVGAVDVDSGHAMVGELRVMNLVGVNVELPSAYPEVVMREVGEPWRELRFPIGYAEGMAIALAWRRIPTVRPTTHEVWAETLRQLNATIEVIRITSFEGGIYYAEIVLSGASGSVTIQCRPSDAIAISLRQDFSVPILVAESILSVASGAVGGNAT